MLYFFALQLGAAWALATGHVTSTGASAGPPPPPQWMEWPNTVPTGKGDGGGPSPFDQSHDVTGFSYWSGGANIVKGTGADTWYPSWSADGSLYTTFTDGVNVDAVTKKHVLGLSCGPCQGNNGSSVTQGFARAVPSKPSSPIESAVAGVVDVGAFRSSALPFQGRYPSGNLFYKGVWYYGTYALAELHGNAQYPCGNWCVQGPFVGFRHSVDKGKNWIEPRMEMARDFASYKASDNLFGELGPVCDGEIKGNKTKYGPYTCTGKWKGKVKFGAPHVVDLGQELEHSAAADADGVKRAYMVGHGADKEYQPQSWMHGSQVYMSRTKGEVSVETMGGGEHWEYFAGYQQPGNTAVWKDDVGDAAPLFTWENRTGVVTMTYMPALKKFIMCVGTPTRANGTKSTVGPFDTYFLESSLITGPFKMVSYLASFGPESYFVNIASSLLDDKGGGFLSYSANFAYHKGHKPLNSSYVWNLLPFRFDVKGEQLQLEV